MTLRRVAGCTLAVGALASSLVALPAGSGAAVAGRRDVVEAEVRAEMVAAGSDGDVTVIVTLTADTQLDRSARGTRAERQRAVEHALRSTADSSQRGVRSLLAMRHREGSVEAFQPMWITNSVVVTATPAVVDELAARPEVDRIALDAIDVVPTGTPVEPAEPNVVAVNAPTVWQTGHDGEGVVVAVLDTGVDASHPDLAGRWRGGTNSWFDPYGQHATPFDPTGHGTAVTGALVGGGAGGTTVGVAPGARWIAARVFDDAGHATTSAIHAALQWVLDPDGNPATADAPSVVNNSWAFGTVGCDLEFQSDLQALRAAGILPVFAAGNAGPGAGTDVSPANYPEAIAVGAITAANSAYQFGSRGPTSCGGVTHPYPSVVAPGVNIWTTDRMGLYGYWTGTSIAAPAVSGALAVLLSAGAVTDSESALLGTAVDLGTAGVDDVYGRGRIDVAAAAATIATPPPTTTTTTTVPATTTTTTVPPTTTTTTTTTVPPTTTTTTTTVPPPPALLFANGFESGTTSGWTGVATNGGRLTVAAGAALTGAFGLRANVVNTGAMYVADATPSAATSYHARFRFDPNTVTIPSTKRHDVARALTGSGATAAAIQLQRSAAGYQIRAGWLTSSGSTAYSAWVTITDAPHAIELAWNAATTSAGKNGAVVLYVDGVARASKSALSNGTVRVESFRLGPQGVTSGTAGVEYYDDFASTLTAYIGA